MERLRNCGGSLTIPCKGSLIVPSGNIGTLPLVNEFNLDPRRLTNAQSPLGGVNGLVDYAPGSVHVTEGDGIYLTDVVGNNTSKDLPAGLLSRLGYLTVDPVAHSITEEFIVCNTTTSNNPSQFESWATTNGWFISTGAGTVSIENGKLKCVGTADSSGRFIAEKSNYAPINASTDFFLNLAILSNSAGNVSIGVLTDPTHYIFFEGARFPISANVDTSYVLPIRAPVGTVGQTPLSSFGVMNLSSLTGFLIGVRGLTAGLSVTMYISPLSFDTSRSAYIETAVPDNITSVVFQKWNGSAYETNCIANMDSVYSTTFLDSTKMVLNDGTKFDDVYGSGLGRSRFVKGASGQTVNGSLAGTTMTYSAVKGTKNRIGFRVDLPPSDGGRTSFNQCRVKKIINYTTNSAGKRATTYELSNNNNASTGLLNIAKPWLAIIDPTTKKVDYYIFTERPTSLSYTKDESGNVYEVVVNPGNGIVYKGSTIWANDTLDTNIDSKPDMLDVTVQNSIAQMLSVYGFNG